MPLAALAQLRTVLPFVHSQTALTIRIEAELLFAEAALAASQLQLRLHQTTGTAPYKG